MREIKFRAWDKNLKRWVFGKLTQFGFVTHLEFQPGEVDVSARFPSVPPPRQYDIDEWFQYTGLKDKNGKEIYEGDVVKDVYSFSPEMSFDVHDNEDTFVIHDLSTIYFRHLPGYTAFEAFDDLIQYYKSSHGKYGLEVIGNIYSNPELLKND